MTSGYSRFFRATQMLWRAEQGVHLDPAYRRYCIDTFNGYASQADIAWPGTGQEWPHSVSGSDHLMEHVGHDLQLPERQEIAFRQWWSRVTLNGFTPTKETAQ